MKTTVYFDVHHIQCGTWSSCVIYQAEQELKKDLEVKLAVSSLVCTIADNASTQRLEQSSSEVAQLEALREAGAMEREASLRAELAKTNAVVAGLQADIGAARGWQTGVDNLELKLMAYIEDLKAMVEVCTTEYKCASAQQKRRHKLTRTCSHMVLMHYCARHVSYDKICGVLLVSRVALHSPGMLERRRGRGRRV